jgi:hypothetical protein
MKTSNKIDESQFHEIWARQDFLAGLETFSGETISILNPGQYNSDSVGPDFKNARIKIGNLTFVGDIEIDPDYSDWKNHGHNINKHYNKVVLHVCLSNKYNQEYVYSSDGRKIHSISVDQKIPQDNLNFKVKLAGKFKTVQKYHLKCAGEVESIDTEFKRKYVMRLGLLRFQKKCERMFHRLKELKFISELKLKEPVIRFEMTNEFNKRDFINSDFHEKAYWSQLFYEFIFEALGYSKNKSIMLKLAQNVKVDFLINYKNSPNFHLILESVLYNAAGLMPRLNDELKSNSDYVALLAKIWSKLGKEYDGKKFDETQWQFLGQRPQNFPTVRIAGGAKILYSLISQNLISEIFKKFSEIKSTNVLINTIRSLFIIKSTGYWQDHYIFEKISAHKINYFVGLGRGDEIFINVILPFLFIYYEIFGNEELSKKVLKVYNEYEQHTDNRIVKEVSDTLSIYGLNKKSVYSQGMIELYRNYCTKNRCLDCDIGKRIFT